MGGRGAVLGLADCGDLFPGLEPKQVEHMSVRVAGKIGVSVTVVTRNDHGRDDDHEQEQKPGQSMHESTTSGWAVRLGATPWTRDA